MNKKGNGAFRSTEMVSVMDLVKKPKTKEVSAELIGLISAPAATKAESEPATVVEAQAEKIVEVIKEVEVIKDRTALKKRRRVSSIFCSHGKFNLIFSN